MHLPLNFCSKCWSSLHHFSRSWLPSKQLNKGILQSRAATLHGHMSSNFHFVSLVVVVSNPMLMDSNSIEGLINSVSILLPCLPGLSLTLGYFLIFLCHLALHHHTFRISCQHGPFHAGKETFRFRSVISLAGPPRTAWQRSCEDMKICEGFSRIDKIMELHPEDRRDLQRIIPSLRGSLAHFLLLHQFAFNQFQPQRLILNTGLNIQIYSLELCHMPTQHLEPYSTSCAMHGVIQHNDVYCMLVYITISHAYMQKITCYAGFKRQYCKHLHMNLKSRASCTWSEVKPSSSSSSCSWKSQHTWKSRVDRSWRTAAMTIHDTMNTDTCQRRDEHEVFEDEVFMIDNTKVIRSLAGIITWYPVNQRKSCGCEG